MKGRSLWPVGVLLAAITIASSLGSPKAYARDLFESEDGQYRLVLRSALKGSWLLTFPPDDPLLPEERGGGAFFRLRFDLSTNLTEYFSANVAYEHRALAATGGSVGVGFLPPNLPPFFRLVSVDGSIVDAAPGYIHRHELDRAYVSLHLPFLELSVGRQAVGLGRGVLFSAVDLFSPFSPLEVDREWRRGIDAVHAEMRIPEVPELSADLIAAFGAVQGGALQSWSMVGRIRALIGDVDAALIAGRRGEDLVLGGVVSANIGDAEMHSELSLFRTNAEGIGPGLLGSDRYVGKALLGGSYVFDVHRGLHAVLEYHYSGFGVSRIAKSPALLFDPAFQLRMVRGDSQLLGRHVIALVLSGELIDDLSASLSYLQSPIDGSGMIAPGLVWTQSDLTTLSFSGFVPWGKPPEGGIPRSEWGSSPVTLFLQARFYD